MQMRAAISVCTFVPERRCLGMAFYDLIFSEASPRYLQDKLMMKKSMKPFKNINKRFRQIDESFNGQLKSFIAPQLFEASRR